MPTGIDDCHNELHSITEGKMFNAINAAQPRLKAAIEAREEEM
jgi:hypothetical protein